MNQKELEQMKQRLFSLRSEFQEIEKASYDSNKTVELDQTRVGRLSRMDAMQAQQMALETTRRNRRQQVKIENTLRRIDLQPDEYGYCFDCGEEINIRRLFIDPTNTLCIKCAD